MDFTFEKNIGEFVNLFIGKNYTLPKLDGMVISQYVSGGDNAVVYFSKSGEYNFTIGEDRLKIIVSEKKDETANIFLKKKINSNENIVLTVNRKETIESIDVFVNNKNVFNKIGLKIKKMQTILTENIIDGINKVVVLIEGEGKKDVLETEFEYEVLELKEMLEIELKENNFGKHTKIELKGKLRKDDKIIFEDHGKIILETNPLEEYQFYSNAKIVSVSVKRGNKTLFIGDICLDNKKLKMVKKREKILFDVDEDLVEKLEVNGKEQKNKKIAELEQNKKNKIKITDLNSEKIEILI